jgi:hypothetical protein
MSIHEPPYCVYDRGDVVLQTHNKSARLIRFIEMREHNPVVGNRLLPPQAHTYKTINAFFQLLDNAKGVWLPEAVMVSPGTLKFSDTRRERAIKKIPLRFDDPEMQVMAKLGIRYDQI